MDCKKHVSSNSPFIKVNEWSMYIDMGLAPAQRRGRREGLHPVHLVLRVPCCYTGSRRAARAAPLAAARSGSDSGAARSVSSESFGVVQGRDGHGAAPGPTSQGWHV